MSTSKEIKRMLAQYSADKKQEHLQDANLKDLANYWGKVTDQKDQKQQDEFKEAFTPEVMTQKVDSYMEMLNNGNYDIADFDKIEQFFKSFEMQGKDVSLDIKLNNLRAEMGNKKFTLEHGNAFKFSKEQKDALRLPNIDHVEIRGNKEIVDNLQDKKDISGKSFVIRNQKAEVLSTVEYDKDGNANITCQNEGKLQKYQISKDKRVYKFDENGNKQELNIQNKEALSKADKHAVMSGVATKKIWQEYTTGKLKPEPKKVKINEEQKSEKNKVTINEGSENTDKPKTRISENEAQERTDGELNTGTDNQYGPDEVKLDWKEEDIIKVMFEKWFIAALNAAAEWTIQKCEQVVYGALNGIASSMTVKREEREEPKKEKTKDYTQQFSDKITEASNKKMENNLNGLDLESVKADAKEGKYTDILAKSDAIRNFAQATNINIGELLNKGDINKTAPLLISMSADYAKFADNYAQASLLDEKLKDKRAHENRNPEDLYDAKIQEAAAVLKNDIFEYTQKNPNASGKDFEKLLSGLSKDMESALKVAKKDLKKGRYNENGKQPNENNDLIKHTAFLKQQEPQSLVQEAQLQQTSDEKINSAKSDLKTRNEELNAQEEELNNRRESLNQTKDRINKGKNNTQVQTQGHEQEQVQTQINNQKKQISMPKRDQGRE